MPTRLCSDYSQGHGCPNPATYRGRCQRHAKQRNTETHKNKSLYNSKRWQVLRRSVLFNHPLCQCPDPECNEISTDVDHIIPVEDGGPMWDRRNLQTMTHAHHAEKTNAEMRAR